MRQDSRLLRFFGELRRRKVLTTLAGYLVVGLGVMEGTEILVPRLGLPDVTVTIVLGVLFAGLPVMLTVSWIYDVSLGGLVRDPGDIEGRSGDGGNPGPVEVERRELDPRAVAVLPFQNLGGNGDDEYFSEGITEEVSAALCRIPTIRVISRTSVVELRSRGATGLRDIGHGLGVGVVVEGSVRRQRNRVRIVARSVDVGTESAIWSETYDREVEDIFEVQSDVAGRVAEAMRVGLDPTMDAGHRRQRTSDPRAYDLYLQALYQWNRRSGPAMEEARRLMDDARTLDPEFALAHAGLAMIQLTRSMYNMAGPEAVLSEALPAARKALELAPDTAEALVARGAIRAMCLWEWEEGEADFKAAIRARPSYATAFQWLAMNVLAPRARYAEAGSALERAVELDPMSPAVRVSSGVLAYFEGDPARALAIYDEVERRHPEFDALNLFRGQALVAAGRPDAGVEELETGLERTPGGTEIAATLAHALAAAGREDAARARLGSLRDGDAWVSPVLLAQVHAGLGDVDAALGCLEDAEEQRPPDLAWLAVRPTFAELREHDEVRALLTRMGLST